MQVQHIEFLQLLNEDVQYVVPRWQRRYCWGQLDIKRLVDDLLALPKANPDATHYAGTLLTFREPGAAGVLSTIRVVDGQQRLTTVSILLGCIAKKLERDGRCGDWTAEIIRERRLTNPHMPQEKRFKLRLQSEDDDEFRCGLNGKPQGSGAVAQAWKIAWKLVEDCETVHLLAGLERLRVVSIGLGVADDPQQIFESLNATGRPLKESEKVKNWLLIGLPENEQQELHDKFWRAIEKELGAKHKTEPIDDFLRDLMRWRTGETGGGVKTYEQFRRWAGNHGHTEDRPALMRDLARLAHLYGILTGTAGEHCDRKIEAELRHLRAMGIDVHRPLTLRLLDEASENNSTQVSREELAKTIAGIGTWITRLWLADRSTASMAKEFVRIAYGTKSNDELDYAEHWLDQIRSLRTRRTGVPRDQEIRECIGKRKAYGGTATRAAFAVLCELMETEQPGEAPARDRLTLEHVMPQKLTREWERDLGEDAKEVHEEYKNRLANLTLSGDVINAGMGANTFAAKQEFYRRSSVGMTRRLSDEEDWNEAALLRRAEELTCRALERWPWNDDLAQVSASFYGETAFRWRIENNEWQEERVGSNMVLNVVAALLSQDAMNCKRLQGENITTDIHPAIHYPAGTKSGSGKLFAVPEHDDWTLYPYAGTVQAYRERCRKLGERCGVRIQVELSTATDVMEAFWRYLKGAATGLFRQNQPFRSKHLPTKSCNSFGDFINIYIGNTDSLWLSVKIGDKQSVDRVLKSRHISWMILEKMADQQLSDDLEKETEKGRTVRVERNWVRENEDEWGEVCQWIQDQCERLCLILKDFDRMNGETIN